MSDKPLLITGGAGQLGRRARVRMQPMSRRSAALYQGGVFTGFPV